MNRLTILAALIAAPFIMTPAIPERPKIRPKEDTDMNNSYTVRIGRYDVDLLNPQPEQIDLEAIAANLDKTLRWTSNPQALSVRQHQLAVGHLAEKAAAPPNVVDWCEHHDDHEGIIGDITGPIKAILAEHTPVLARMENRLDYAICVRRKANYPSAETKGMVHYFDKLCETLEWRFILCREPMPWLRQLPVWMTEAHAKCFILQYKDR